MNKRHARLRSNKPTLMLQLPRLVHVLCEARQQDLTIDVTTYLSCRRTHACSGCRRDHDRNKIDCVCQPACAQKHTYKRILRNVKYANIFLKFSDARKQQGIQSTYA